MGFKSLGLGVERLGFTRFVRMSTIISGFVGVGGWGCSEYGGLGVNGSDCWGEVLSISGGF